MVEWFAVGGAVRDMLLGRGFNDVDFSFRGSAKDFLQCFPSARNTGRAFPIWLSSGVEYTELEDNWEADFAARDLTINACAMDAEGSLYAHPCFAEDMRNRILRLASPHSIQDDPLRIFRIARFYAAMPEFCIAPETLHAMRQFASASRAEIAAIPKERVARELMRALSAPKPSNFLAALLLTDCLDPWFEEHARAASITAGPQPWHDNTVLEHTMQVMDRCAGHPLAVWMALCHDLGKVLTRPEDLPHHYGHEKTGADLARNLGERLGMPSRYIRASVVGTLCHMKGGVYGSLRAGTRRDLLVLVKNAGIMHDFWLLAGADGNVDWEPAALQDLQAMESVHLPKEWQGKGEESGRRLRNMQCEVMSRLPKPMPRKLRGA
mgnify:CR=1 FL=1